MSTSSLFLTTDSALAHWQAHRRLTRRLIEAFPDDQLFTFALGGMRTFGTLVMELLSMDAPTVRGIATGSWDSPSDRTEKTKAELLAQWDANTVALDEFWPQIPVERFQETMTAFGQWTMPVHALVMYVIDNEIHHRGQAFVYMRALGIEPPPFWDRQ